MKRTPLVGAERELLHACVFGPARQTLSKMAQQRITIRTQDALRRLRDDSCIASRALAMCAMSMLQQESKEL